MINLDKKESITLGFNWDPNMSFDEFVKKNNRLQYNKAWEIFNLIEQRYIEYKYEN